MEMQAIWRGVSQPNAPSKQDKTRAGETAPPASKVQPRTPLAGVLVDLLEDELLQALKLRRGEASAGGASGHAHLQKAKLAPPHQWVTLCKRVLGIPWDATTSAQDAHCKADAWQHSMRRGLRNEFQSPIPARLT